MDTLKLKELPNRPVESAVDSRNIILDTQNLPNPFDDTLLHEHSCRNCGRRYHCALPLCNGSWLDAELCPDCEPVLEAIGYDR